MKDFEQLYRKHVDAVFRFSLRCIGRRDLAEDITSEAFLELYSHLDEIEPERLPAWLFTVAKNRAIDYWRARTKEQQVSAETLPEARNSPGMPLESFLLERATLKPIHRICLILRYIHGMTRSEIAQRVGLSETQVKGYLQYALQLLRKELAPHRGRPGYAKALE